MEVDNQRSDYKFESKKVKENKVVARIIEYIF